MSQQLFLSLFIVTLSILLYQLYNQSNLHVTMIHLTKRIARLKRYEKYSIREMRKLEVQLSALQDQFDRMDRNSTILEQYKSIVKYSDRKRCSHLEPWNRITPERLALKCQTVDYGYSQKNRLYFHTYVDGDFHVTLKYLIMSYLVTQDLKVSKFIIWHKGKKGFAKNQEIASMYADYPDNIEFKVFKISKFIAGTCLSNRLFENQIAKMNAAYRISMYSDIVRILLLNKYGGVWLDWDNVLVKNLLPLISVGHEFSSIIDDKYWNNHVLHLYKGSTTKDRLLQAACDVSERNVSSLFDTYHDYSLYNDVVIKYCNSILNCDITKMSTWYFWPNWHLDLWLCKNEEDAQRTSIPKSYSKETYVLHHQMWSCWDKIPQTNFMKKLLTQLEVGYEKRKGQPVGPVDWMRPSLLK